ncbi:MAG: hypothetical protein WAW11_02760 [Patescibacteria group bacterium]
MKTKTWWQIPALLMILMAITRLLTYWWTGEVPTVGNISFYHDIVGDGNHVPKLNFPYLSKFWDIPAVGIFALIVIFIIRLINKFDSIGGMQFLKIIVFCYFGIAFIIFPVMSEKNPFAYFLIFLVFALFLNIFITMLGEGLFELRDNILISSLIGLFSGAFLSLNIGVTLGLFVAIIIFLIFAVMDVIFSLIKSLFLWDFKMSYKNND